ncbi:WAP four-disulfide core domain protein 5-like [Bufo bufo]|uniref:WAP four-disulfide core domain protein 5-like n=1 Tax=Bufo bufo TaxID=8384 RepID=UPI001ABE1D3D|nr:WAP four-disulfide core domain protein 5-like [Bufo bufo]
MLCCAGALADYYDEPTPSPPEKSGKCPLDPLAKCRPKIPPDQCNLDDDCYGKEKCCRIRCTRECIDPIEETPGTCPPPRRTGCSPYLDPGYCEVDSDCPGKEKCYVMYRPECIEV